MLKATDCLSTPHRAWIGWAVGSLAAAAFTAPAGLAAQEPVAWRGRVDTVVRAEVSRLQLPSFALVLVDREGTLAEVVAGSLRLEEFEPADSRTLYRTGSVGKTLTDLAILAAADAGRLDLDVDVRTYLPEFAPVNPFGEAITLRHLMRHEAGLVREPPVGSYFDASSPSLAQTVASLNRTELLWEPGSKTKYSNAGLAVAGRVLEVAYGRDFHDVVAELVLRPAGMTDARVGRPEEPEAEIAEGMMWDFGGRRWAAPTFDLGMVPAGDFYASTSDMASFMRTLLAEGGGIVSEETWATMWRPDPPRDDWHLDVGLGFSLNGKFAGQYRMARHGGAVYGFSSELALLPAEGLGVYAVAAREATNGVVQGVAHWALLVALAARRGEGPPPYESAPSEIAESRARIESCETEQVPEVFAPYVGDYGPDHNPLHICVRDGELHVRLEWFFLYPLSTAGEGSPEDGVFAFPSYALYGHESLRFARGPDGSVTAAVIGHGSDGVRFVRRGPPG